MDKDPKVIPLPLIRERATEIVREISKTDRWSVHIQYPPNGEWRRVVNRRQIELCLKEGYILQKHARLDEHGNWRFSIGRVCGGLNVEIGVALERTELPRLFVISIKGDHIKI